MSPAGFSTTRPAAAAITGTGRTQVPDCEKLTPENVPELSWLPPTCAYRLVDEGRDLYWWHPLVSGDPDTVHYAGISVRGRTLSEADVPVQKFEEHVVDWPGENPAEMIERRAEGEEEGEVRGWRCGLRHEATWRSISHDGRVSRAFT